MRLYAATPLSAKRHRAGRLCLAAAGIARPVRLDRRTGDRAVRTEHTAIAGLGPEKRAATSTVIEELAGVDWHFLRHFMMAIRTGERREALERAVRHTGSRATATRCRLQDR